MTTLYLVIVILLVTLAIVDLVVGVSNDAVNFLNSAIGSKVTSIKNILFVAALGVLLGATFSNGIMEVARKGIFNPGEFYFNEIMFIFLAVMLTDIILLDLFNTFGMPTSTTVSIVFELLGAAVAISMVKIFSSGESIADLDQYINASRAILIISGIFISVGIAFVVGSIVQRISRIILSFQYEKRLKYFGGVWPGLALATLTLFLVFKGLKGTSYVSEDFLAFVKNNTWMLFGVSFVFWSIVMQILTSVFKINVLKIVVLIGTFSLAMAFAGNDLVNFIGVPLAGLESYHAWIDSGLAPEAFSMEILNEKVQTKTILLLGAGVVMVLALVFSKKARYVTETEVNLGRQNEGDERFSPNWLSQQLVWASRKIANGFEAVVPQRWLDKMDENFQKPQENNIDNHAPAFDLVRASVNLVVASMLIAFATSLKLPLSTTYVSFMVAMGTSLADNAWGRDSAVYRIAGVFNVIGGWFLTAIIAFTVSGIFALVLFYFEIWGIIVLVVLAVSLVVRTMMIHRNRMKEREKSSSIADNLTRSKAEKVVSVLTTQIAIFLINSADLLTKSVEGLQIEDRGLLSENKKAIKKLNKANRKIKDNLVNVFPSVNEEKTEISRYYLLIYDLEQDLLQSLGFLSKFISEHVKNSLTLPTAERLHELQTLVQQTAQFLQDIATKLEDLPVTSQLETFHNVKVQLYADLEEMISRQILDIKSGTVSRKSSRIVFDVLMELKDITAIAYRFYKLSIKALDLENRGGFYIKKKVEQSE